MMSYDEMKASNTPMRIAEWFDIDEKLQHVKGYHFEGGDFLACFEVVEEREKAIKVKWRLRKDNGYYEREVYVWLPKKALEPYADYQAREHAKELRKYERYQEGCKRYQELIEFAKSNGVKVRQGMKRLTILSKLEEAGINKDELKKWRKNNDD